MLRHGGTAKFRASGGTFAWHGGRPRCAGGRRSRGTVRLAVGEYDPRGPLDEVYGMFDQLGVRRPAPHAVHRGRRERHQQLGGSPALVDVRLVARPLRRQAAASSGARPSTSRPTAPGPTAPRWRSGASGTNNSMEPRWKAPSMYQRFAAQGRGLDQGPIVLPARPRQTIDDA
jgi:hypothetical protein